MLCSDVRSGEREDERAGLHFRFSALRSGIAGRDVDASEKWWDCGGREREVGRQAGR